LTDCNDPSSRKAQQSKIIALQAFIYESLVKNGF